jgi:hypothetical protein
VCAKWERMWGRRDNQEVGLEAATLERVRNSSLVKWSCADNVAGLKRTAEAVSFTHTDPPVSSEAGAVVWMGRGASCIQGSGDGSQPWRVWE